MKTIRLKFGLSHYNLKMTAEEYAQYRSLKDRTSRHLFARKLWIGQEFGSAGKALDAVQNLISGNRAS